MIDTRPLTNYSDATILHWLERALIIEAYEHAARLRDEAKKRGLIK